MKKLNGYTLSEQWFNFAFANQDIVSPAHTALFCWFIELNNRMGWVEKFASPASQSMAATGIKSYNTYIKIYEDLKKFGFVKEVVKSINQYHACIIALSLVDNPNNKALEKSINKASKNQSINQTKKPVKSNDSIIKPITVEPSNSKTDNSSPPLIATGKESELMDPCKKLFMDFYLEKNIIVYDYSGIDGKKLKSILVKIVRKIKEKFPQKESFLFSEVVQSFQWYFTNTLDFADGWVKDHYTLTVLDSKFNEIYLSIKNGKTGSKSANGGGNSKAGTSDGVVGAINAMFDKTNSD